LLFSIIISFSFLMQNPEKILLTDFEEEDLKNWIIVNDGVMGGLSTSQIQYLPESRAIYSGTVSLENNGGFASSRMKIEPNRMGGSSSILLRVKGDGKKYKFRIRTDDQMDGITYSADFRTKKNEWMEIELPFNLFKPTYRGRILDHIGPIKAEDIRQVGILISDKQSGPFSITLDWIKCS